MAIYFLQVTAEDFMGFRGKHHIKLELDPGLYYLTGKNLDNPRMGANGCGKSTILNLIYWTLTGELLDISKPGDEVVPWDAKSRKVRGRIWFEIDGQLYGIERKRAPNGLFMSTGLKGDFEQVEQSRIRQLLGLSNEALKRTIILGQHSDLFLDLGPTEQSKFFSDILDLDFWVNAARLASSSASSTFRACSDMKVNVHQMEGQLETTDELMKQAGADADKWQLGKKDRVAQARSELIAAEARHESAEEVLRKSSQPERTNEEIVKLRANKDDLVEKASAYQMEAGDRNGVLLSLKRELEALNKTRNTYVLAMKDKTCPECGQTVKASHIKIKLKVLDDQIKEIEEQLPGLAEEVATLHGQSDKCCDLRDELVELIDSKVRTHNALLSSYAVKLAAVTTAASAVGQAKSTLKYEQEAENPHETTEARLKKKLADLTRDLAAAKTKLEEQLGKAEGFELAEKYFKEIRLSLIDEVLTELEITIGAYAEQLGLIGWKIKFSTERELKSGGTSIGLTTMLYPPDAPEKPINWRVYSGGERQRWQLAVTFGLSEVLLGRAGLESNIEFLDEPTRGTSAEGVEDLIEHLSQRARQYKKAIVLVDHHVLDRGLFDHTMVVIRENNQSRLESA